MTDVMNQPLDELKEMLLADGVIDAEETTALRERIFADGVIDREEADFLFDMNDATSGKANHSTGHELFVAATSRHVLEDEDSPGEIDDAEASWLVSRIEGDEQLDANERALLVNIRNKASAIPDRLVNLIESL